MQLGRKTLHGATRAALGSPVVSRSFRFCIITLSIVLIAHRAPAPIIEATPSSEEESKQPARSKRRSSETSEPAKRRERFAGTWSGKINQGIVGDVGFTLTFTGGDSQVTEHSSFGT